MRHVAAVVAGLALALLAAPSGAGSVSGTFVEKPSGAPLAAVEVVLRGTADSAVVAHGSSAEDGRFRLDGVGPGRYRLRASLLGHATFVRDDLVLTAAAPDADLGTLALAVAPVAVPGVTTSTARATAILAPDRNIYLAKDLPAAAAGTATDVLRAVPELDVDINGKVSLRGSTSVTIQFNGRPAPMSGEALDTYLRQFPANRIERIEVVANPSARYDPEGMSGIVNIVLKEGVDLGLSGSVFLSGGTNSLSPGARLAWQKGPLTLFGGVSGYGNANHSTYRLARENFDAGNLAHYRVASENDNRNTTWVPDASADFALTKRATLYSTLNGYLGRYRWLGAARYTLSDAAYAPASDYERTNDGRNAARTGTATLGWRHVALQGRDERSVELRQSDSRQTNPGRGDQRWYVPADSAGNTSWVEGAYAGRERSLQADDTHPLGAKGKLESGYRGSERLNTNSRALAFEQDGVPIVTPQTIWSDYEHHEVFHSGYLTAGSTFGRASVQLGVRGEAARTTFETRRTGDVYRNDYRSVFPSANLAWDFGRGVTTRLSYSKRIERPGPWLLNPDVPTVDPLNRTVGNPSLRPKYTHSVSLEAGWTGSRGSLRFSPYARRTIANWDQVTTVDSAGAATTTWRNASSVGFLGASLTASLRQVGKLGGTASVSVWRERHDAANLGAAFRRDATNWSANGNVQYQALKKLSAQLFLRYNPAQTQAQGRTAANVFTNIGARWEFNPKASLGLWVNDPLNRWKYEATSGDDTYAQTVTNRYTMRAVTLSLSWSWGKPPEQKPRKQTDQPQTEPTNPGP